MPARVTRYNTKRRYLKVYAVGLMDYAAGMACLAATDLLSGWMIVRALAITAHPWAVWAGAAMRGRQHIFPLARRKCAGTRPRRYAGAGGRVRALPQLLLRRLRRDAAL